MKKKSLYIFGVLLCLITSSYGQIIFENPQIKNLLITDSYDHVPYKVDLNGNGEIELSEALNITELRIRIAGANLDTYSTNDFSNFTNLEKLTLNKGTLNTGTLTSINISGNTKLKSLHINGFKINSLNTINNSNIENLYLLGCNFSSLSVSHLKKLSRLQVIFNHTDLNSIDVSNNPLLETLTLEQSGITSVDVTKNGTLKALNINRNPITELNILNNCNLAALTCTNTNVETIDARNCQLTYVTLGNTDEEEYGPTVSSTLKKVYLTGQPLSLASGEHFQIQFFQCANLDFICVDSPYIDLISSQMNNNAGMMYTGNNPDCTITTACDTPEVAGNCITTPICPIINFPDPNFKQALLSYSPVIDTDGDGEICIDEAEAVTYLSLESKNINDITGIEHFINITLLKLGYNNITSADLSKNLKIRQVSINSNQLTYLNVKNNKVLEDIFASYNQLTSIDISTNNSLKSFHFHNNNLTYLNASNLTNLTYFGAIDNLLTSINITNCSSLSAIQIWGNEIRSLDISTNNNLEFIHASNNKITELNITPNNNKIKVLALGNNLITEIDIRNCTSIRSLSINNNPNLEKAYLTGSHEFYGSFDYFFDRTLSININYRDCPKLNFICVNNVSFFNDIKTFTTGMYPACTVSTNCDSTTPTVDFNTYFRLSPNPTTGSMWLTRVNSRVNVIAADIYNAQTGAFVKTVDILFEGGFLTPKENFKTATNTIQRIDEPISLYDSAFIDCYDVQRGTYILKVYSSRGTFSTTFIKSTEAIR